MIRSSTSKPSKTQGYLNGGGGGKTQKPKNWPDDVIYIDKPVYHSSVPKDVVMQLKRPQSQSQLSNSSNANTFKSNTSRPMTMARPLSSSYRIQMIKSPSHPANGQRGLFATKKIEPNTLIVYYLGEVHCEDRVTSDYDLSLLRTSTSTITRTSNEAKDEDRYINIGIDASRMGNEGRFVNDYRGIASRANAVFKEVRMKTGMGVGMGVGLEADGQLTMGIWSGPQSQGIKKGEEIVVSYGKAWWASRRHDS
jgi:hypothetical protein